MSTNTDVPKLIKVKNGERYHRSYILKDVILTMTGLLGLFCVAMVIGGTWMEDQVRGLIVSGVASVFGIAIAIFLIKLDTNPKVFVIWRKIPNTGIPMHETLLTSEERYAYVVKESKKAGV